MTLLESIDNVITIEFGNLEELKDLDTFANMTENYRPEGVIYFNKSNVIFTNEKDFNYCSYYGNELTAHIKLPEYQIEIWAISLLNNPLMKQALKLM